MNKFIAALLLPSVAWMAISANPSFSQKQTGPAFPEREHPSIATQSPLRSQQIPNIQLDTSPALAVFQGKLYLAHKGLGSNNNIYYTFSEDGGVNWAPEKTIPNVAVQQSPALAAFQNKLYLAHRGGTSSNDNIYYMSFDGTNWAPEQIVTGPNGQAASTATSPALTEFNNQLYLAHKGSGSDPNIYYTSFNGTSWASEQIVEPNGAKATTTTSPGLAKFQNRLYLAHRGGTSSNDNIYYTSFDGTNWASEQIAVGSNGQAASTATSPTPMAFNNRLHLAHKGSGSNDNIYYTGSSDGVHWDSEQIIPGVATSTSPALAVSPNGNLYLAHKGGYCHDFNWWSGNTKDDNTSLYFSWFDGSSWSNTNDNSSASC